MKLLKESRIHIKNITKSLLPIKLLQALAIMKIHIRILLNILKITNMI